MALGMIAQTVVVGRIELRSVPEQQAIVLNEFFLCHPRLALLQRLQSVTAKSGAPGLGQVRSLTNGCIEVSQKSVIHLKELVGVGWCCSTPPFEAPHSDADICRLTSLRQID